MRALLIGVLLLMSYTTSAQNIKFKIEGHKDTTVHLVKYFGKKLFYADTAGLKNGVVQFDGSKQKPGILGLYIPGYQGNAILEFVYNQEKEIFIEAKLSNLMGTAKAKKSVENDLFLNYVQYIQTQRGTANRLNDQLNGHDKGSEMYEKISKQITETNQAVEDYQLNIANDERNLLVSKIVRMSMDVKIPEAPKDEAGNIIDSNFRFNYFRKHYFDNIDLNDDRLVRTPVFHNKFANYFSKNMMIQHWDTVIYYAYDFCDRLNQKSDMFQYCVSWITSNYEKSKIMGMNKVFVYMGKKYYCATNEEGKSPAHWMPEDKLKTLCEKVNTHYDLVMGAKPPNLILRDTTDVNWVDFYSLDNEYTVLYFWDPECGHCKKITPKLQTLYEKKWRDRNIDIYAVGKAVGEDFEKWKAFIKKHNLEFINAAVTRDLYNAAMKNAAQFVPRYTTIKSLNYQQTYDIYATPKVWVLDKDKKIIAYSLTVSQLEDLMDRLQNKKDSPKIFPPEKNQEDEQMH